MIKKIAEQQVFKSKVFTIKDVKLTTPGGEVTYQIVEKRDGVILVPITKDKKVILVREYFAGINAYTLSLPKGQIDDGHDELQTANKELQEEIGYKATKLKKIGVVTVSPGYLTQKISIYLAMDLQKSKLAGDEDEELEVVPYPFKDFGKLIVSGKIADARIISALYLAQKTIHI